MWLTSLDLSKMRQGWGQPQVDKSVTGKPLSIGGQSFAHGVGTHAAGSLHVDLKGGCEEFAASVGVDDDVAAGLGSVEFCVIGDGRVMWTSGLMKAGQPARRVELKTVGVRTLGLVVRTGGDGDKNDHADWADARFECAGPTPETVPFPPDEAVILTPKSGPGPRINGPSVYGARPGSPFLFTIPATGDRPMTFEADGLPEGLSLDRSTGIMTGSLVKAGATVVTLRAANAAGKAERKFRIVAGDQLAMTPPMGWNSWYCLYWTVSDRDMRAAADVMVSKGLINHGYAYVDIDDCWSIKPDSTNPLLIGEPRDARGMINANGKFPDMKALTDYIHSKGLKAGIYSSPGPLTCGGFVASYEHEEQDAQRFAEWGFDLLKYDWCSYAKVAKDRSLDELKKPYVLMGKALRRLNRDVVFNLCQYGMGNVSAWGGEVGGHSWRTTDDVGVAPQGLWVNIERMGFGQNGLEKWAGPGRWNDPDYLLLGKIGDRKGGLVSTPLSHEERYAYMSLWSLLAAPLFLSGDMPSLDDFSLSLLTNDEVLEVNQDALGKQAARVVNTDETDVWAKDMEDGSKAVGLFNRGELPQNVSVRWADLGIKGRHVVRDLWRQKDVGTFAGQFESLVPRHGVVLVRIRAEQK